MAVYSQPSMEAYNKPSMEAYSPLYDSIYNSALEVRKLCFEQGFVALIIHRNNSVKHSLSKANKSDMYMQTELRLVLYISFHLIAIQTTINGLWTNF